MTWPIFAISFRQCAWCGKFLSSVAVPHKDPAEGMISHGICSDCERVFLKELEAYTLSFGGTFKDGTV